MKTVCSLPFKLLNNFSPEVITLFMFVLVIVIVIVSGLKPPGLDRFENVEIDPVTAPAFLLVL